jgi:hypothetical protein
MTLRPALFALLAQRSSLVFRHTPPATSRLPRVTALR